MLRPSLRRGLWPPAFPVPAFLVPTLLVPALLVLALVFAGRAAAQSVPAGAARADTTAERVVDLAPIVVTATRSAKTLARVPVPTTLITRAAIEARGARRLSDVLAEETGLLLSEDHGTGVQLQGFDPAYTLILIDGDPVVGRTAGTLDLDRLSVAGVERVEVVRGPSSSLYGSEALAGVVNIITRAPEERADGYVATRYETHGTTTLAGEGALRRGPLGLRLTFDRYASDGYDLSPARVGATAPRFTDYTVAARADLDLDARTALRLDARLATQTQRNRALFVDADATGGVAGGAGGGDGGRAADGAADGAAELRARDDARRTEWSLAPRLSHRFRGGHRLQGRLYATRFATLTTLEADADGTRLSTSRFDQRYGKAEVQLDAVLGARHLLTAGAGTVAESVAADRIRGDRQRMASAFGFVQHEYLPAGWLDVSASARLDVHSAYGTHLSPKLAALVRPAERLRLRASVGSGFKAPTFQQLYLDFTNATVGYSVYGSEGAAEALRQLEASGQVVRFLTRPEALDTIRPESSVAFNVGIEGEPARWLEARLGVFHNEVRDLIETAPVAVKASGQSAYTYFNVSRIYTRGAEAELTVRPLDALTLVAGYQVLAARDRAVLDAIDAGTLYRRAGGRDRRVTRADYGGLMNRSRHALTLRLQLERDRFTASLRALYRSRYGFGDVNGNLVLDDEREYVPGYWLWHVTLTRTLFDHLSVQAGARNLLDTTNPEQIPSLPGRLLFVGLRLAL